MNSSTNDFRVKFKFLSPQSIVSKQEFAELLNVSVGALTQMDFRNELPARAFPEKRKCVWFAGEIQNWLNNKCSSHQVPYQTSELKDKESKKIGRPRQAEHRNHD